MRPRYLVMCLIGFGSADSVTTENYTAGSFATSVCDDPVEGWKNGLIKVVTGIRRCGKSYLLTVMHILKFYLKVFFVSE